MRIVQFYRKMNNTYDDRSASKGILITSDGPGEVNVSTRLSVLMLELVSVARAVVSLFVTEATGVGAF